MTKAFPIILSCLLCLIYTDIYAQQTGSTTSSVKVPAVDYNDEPRPYVINDIKVFGIKYLDPNILIATSGLVQGTTIYIPGTAISQAITRLWNQRYFSDVQIVAEMLPDDKVNLEIYLQERPRVYRWLFEGIRKGEATTLLDEELKLKRGTELSDYILEKNINLIKKHFSKKGFRNTEVTTRIENDSVVQNAVNVIFVIDRKQKVKVGAIDFEGNDKFTDKKLRRTMKKTHAVNINIFQNFKLKEDEYLTDKENILDFYNSQGYRNAVIVSDSIYSINDKRIGIKIKVDEGNKFYIRNITWIGNTKYDTDLLQKMLGVQDGDIYDKKTLYKRLGIGKETNLEDPTQISALYQNEGYLMSVIEPTEIVLGPDSLDLEIKVFEGKPFTINEVAISGNSRVDDEVIRRELYTHPGELYNRALIMQTLRQLSQMQHFDAASIMPQIQPVNNSDLVNIGWPLTETASDKFEISGGWGAGMFVGSVGIQLNNFAIQDFFKFKEWRPYPHGRNQQLLVRAQTNGSYYTSFMGSFTEPWLGGKKPNSLTISAYYSSETDYYNFGGIFQGNKNSYFRTTGVTAGLGQRLSLPDPYFTIYYELGYTAYNLRNWNRFSLFTNGTANIFSFRTVFARSTLSDPIYPSSGTDFSLALTLTPPYSLFDKKDYAAMPASDPQKYKWIEYYKFMGKVQWFLPLTPDRKLVLMAKAELGYLGNYNKHKQSPFEGFDVGGDGMTGYNVYGVDVIGLRGYSEGSLTPYDPANPNTYANVYNKYTLEVRYPFIRQGSTSIYGLVFAEAGNAFQSWEQFDPFKLRRSLGVGVRVFLPMIGMIGLDWGYGFDGTARSDKPHGGKLHFSMGMQF